MYKNVTLNEFIAGLQKLAVEHGNDEILSIGSSSGKIAGMTSPFCFNFKGHDATEFVPAFQEDIKPAVKEAAGEKRGEVPRHVWARVGMTLDITKDEEKAIFEGDYLDGKAALKRIVLDGRAALDGETYIPEECIEDFDREYGTNYRNRDEECAWSLDGDRVNADKALSGLDGIELPSVEQVEELVGHLRKYSEEEYDHHNNYIAEDLADAANVLSKLVDARVFASEDLMHESIDGSFADVYLKSPEYLAELVNMVLHLNVSKEAKKEILVAAFVSGQEYFEKDTERFIQLKAKGPFDVWVFDVFDKNKELLYETSVHAGRLAIDILNGEIVPASMVQEKSVSELISDAADRSEKYDVGESKERDFEKD